ncbi:MAG: aspartyl/asparaginyl beta-hydroxylase domain-containing protein [Eudoraea sp.]|nr:aspartyl/asparaginyl beta-hydroxylase domain-containing protein [Eudoraea sp.]NNK29456.1 aspartyl/asparaginyl beta-hydroxylase domain-containing protein [Flavobacteriaceae bacterium]
MAKSTFGNTKFRLREWVKFKIVRPLLLGIGNRIAKYSQVGDHPLYDSEAFNWTKALEKNYPAIRKEFETILEYRQHFPSLQEIQQEQKVLNQDNNWKTFFLYGFGIKAKKNCSLCPVTSSILEQIPGMKTAFFSVLSPHKHIPAHKGIFNGIIRSHLGIIIPGNYGDCKMRINDKEVKWEEGKVVVFDDTYEHEVWNNTDSTRVVLLIDVIRPFSPVLSWLNTGIVNLIGNSSYVQEAMQNHLEWESRFHSNIQRMAG